MFQLHGYWDIWNIVYTENVQLFVSINLYSDVWTKFHWTELSTIVEYSILSNGTNSIGQFSFPFSPLALQPSLIGNSNRHF